MPCRRAGGGGRNGLGGSFNLDHFLVFGFWFSSFGFRRSPEFGVDSAVGSRASQEKIRVIVLSPTSSPTRETNVVSSPTPAAAPKLRKQPKQRGREKNPKNS